MCSLKFWKKWWTFLLPVSKLDSNPYCCICLFFRLQFLSLIDNFVTLFRFFNSCWGKIIKIFTNSSQKDILKFLLLTVSKIAYFDNANVFFWFENFFISISNSRSDSGEWDGLTSKYQVKIMPSNIFRPTFAFEIVWCTLIECVYRSYLMYFECN